MAHGPTDWVSGERVFAPPSGTLDPDWLVPAVVDAVPGTDPAVARHALVEAWRALRAGEDPATGDPVAAAAAHAVHEARRTFRA